MPRCNERDTVTVQTSPRTNRVADHPAERIFVDRWSPRGFSQEQISEGELRTLFEAARWAPSAYNSQPWRFLYALRGEADFDTFVAPLIEFNRGWAQHAAALIYLLSKKEFTPPGKTEAQFSRTHSFDAGAAWANFANQAAISGWAAHGMSGFDVEKARTLFGVPQGFDIEIVVALGRKGDGAHLAPALLQREQPSPRASVDEFAARGLFPQRFEVAR
ncbi:nitroreductase family protein [Bradyrhizobium sp. INPA01-394B]|uniref:Nitroreductase family protein n=1 Tax=Bradyrhizobium campsiandrae TaxID=1729892 RepID=A0ABR7U8H6_9BRAD|nr:nitroreductase family protein [Bradyrhizobium campsiandrae]MBC9876602.1 nitroreductase family protein [Bradyrhizobium campsiandrae]MBC9979858.1 nitroreductase family protein [Bradyrhizobium campsiandrae]